MSPALLPGCSWEYKDVPDYATELRREHLALIRRLRNGTVTVEQHGTATRAVHAQLFASLTPPEHPYYAGHYRGEAFPCLVDYKVIIPMDPLVGYPPDAVSDVMGRLAVHIRAATNTLDASFAQPDVAVSQKDKLYFAVVIAARLFQEFLTVHPYANGNGHIARFLVWLVLGRFGYWPTKWTIDPSPNVTNYALAISAHRRGHADPLERLILESIVSP